MQRRGDAPLGVVLGTMNLGGRTPPQESRAILHRALERGVIRWDTANVYNDGRSEALVGEVARAHPGRVEIATKVGIGTLSGPPEGLAPATVARALEASLGRLGLPEVALYYLHRPDPSTPLADTVEALRQEHARGRIGAWGLSNHAAWQSLEALQVASAVGAARPVVAQQLYNTLVRDLEHEYLSFAQRFGMHVTVYNPLAGGLLAGHHARGAAPPPGSRFHKNGLYQRRYWSDRLFEVIEDLRGIAQRAELSLVELSYRWLASQKAIDSVILGPATVAHLDAALDALARGPLPADVLRAVDDLYRAYRGTDARYAR